MSKQKENKQQLRPDKNQKKRKSKTKQNKQVSKNTKE